MKRKSVKWIEDMRRRTYTIEEKVSKDYEVEASSILEAVEKAKRKSFSVRENRNPKGCPVEIRRRMKKPIGSSFDTD